MKKLSIVLLTLFIVGCSTLKIPVCFTNGECNGNEIIEAKGAGIRALVALEQAKEREARWNAIKEIASVKKSTAAGEATQAMLTQTIIHSQDGREVAAYYKSEEQITRRPWDLGGKALFAIPLWYTAFVGGGYGGGGDSYESNVSVGGDLTASNSGGGGPGGEGAGGGGVAGNRALAIGSFNTGAFDGDKSGFAWGPFGINEGSGTQQQGEELRPYNFRDFDGGIGDNFDAERAGPLGL